MSGILTHICIYVYMCFFWGEGGGGVPIRRDVVFQDVHKSMGVPYLSYLWKLSNNQIIAWMSRCTYMRKHINTRT